MKYVGHKIEYHGNFHGNRFASPTPKAQGLCKKSIDRTTYVFHQAEKPYLESES